MWLAGVVAATEKEQRVEHSLARGLSANETYAAGLGERSALEMPPARLFAILTRMDARLDPAKFAGLAEGDAHVIRNTGGRGGGDPLVSSSAW